MPILPFWFSNKISLANICWTLTQYRRKVQTTETKDNMDAKLDFRRNKTKYQSKEEVNNE